MVEEKMWLDFVGVKKKEKKIATKRWERKIHLSTLQDEEEEEGEGEERWERKMRQKFFGRLGENLTHWVTSLALALDGWVMNFESSHSLIDPVEWKENENWTNRLIVNYLFKVKEIRRRRRRKRKNNFPLHLNDPKTCLLHQNLSG